MHPTFLLAVAQRLQKIQNCVMVKKDEKARRMEVRKRTGTRTIEPPKNPRYPRGPAYLVAHACFECRKSFKRKPRDHDIACPNCGNVLREMGRSFKAPKKTALKQWQKVGMLWNAGFRFPTSNTDANPYPENLDDVETFIKDNPKHPFRLKEYWR